jgi:hypothetical protein
MLPFIPAQYQFLAKFIVVMAVAGSGAFGAWYVTSDHYQAIIAQHALSDATAVKTELQRQNKIKTDQAEKTRLAEDQHALDQLIINRLSHQPASVQVHTPKCGSAMPGAGQAAVDTNGASGVLSDRVDAAFAELQSQTGQLVERCDQLNIDAIAANNRNH